jgi:hypothetical protein
MRKVLMNLRTRMVLATSLLLMSSFAPASWAGGWTQPLTITSAFTEDSDMIVVYVAEPTTYTAGCAAGSWIFTGANDARRARVWAAVLTALTAGHKVSLWWNDSCATYGFHGFYAIRIVPQG